MGEYETSNHMTPTGESGQVWDTPSARIARRANKLIIAEAKNLAALAAERDIALGSADMAYRRATQIGKTFGKGKK